ncbi:peptidoglycan-recognition protein SB2-like [Macrosteles quadrilineatus]|uniref:peptidoglycan-recognition protein SB2-like n=1 Tax=Macrosteles quadrilineatus TaxID=74068 RepID=UPI0023E28DF1|nr:peptidoglycan-recognition protein SB2-like [Macrosteles quadrilineatus]
MTSYTLIPRSGWSPTPISTQKMALLKSPVDVVFFAYTRKNYAKYGGKDSPGPEPNHEETVAELKYIARGDMIKVPDTRYNFLLGNDGCVYEGRGWKYRPFIPVKYVSLKYYRSIYITFLGDFSEVPPPDSMFKMRDDFLLDSVRKGNLRKKFVIITFATPWNTSHSLRH